MIFYFARVQDTDGKWHRKVGKTSNLDKRFSDKRLYLGWEYIATKQYDKDDIKEVEKQFKDMTIGREHINMNIPPHFMGKTEIIKKDVTDEAVIQRMEEIKIPTKTTLEDF
jgi:hypothetical protein|tara:strand:- start:1320 stop:1652 length:333 start_codon:yes stop_codon:yes gene_type:complete